MTSLMLYEMQSLFKEQRQILERGGGGGKGTWLETTSTFSRKVLPAVKNLKEECTACFLLNFSPRNNLIAFCLPFQICVGSVSYK